MIEFKGELSEKCKNVFFKRHNKTLFLVCNLTWIIIDIPIVLIGSSMSEYSYIWYIIAALFCISALLFCVPALNPQKKAFTDNLPQRITIKDGQIIKDGTGEDCYATGKLENVKKVVDEGDWYLIVFYFPYKISDCICQKDLITQGSIEEFEKMFDGLIVRSKQNNLN